MKRKKAIWLMIMLCWWGFLFPELTFTEDSLRVVYKSQESGNALGDEGELPAEAIAKMEEGQWEKYVALLNAKPEQVKIKSKFMEWLSTLW